jgi:glycosyltransferase involved in cell wall biosynthesis
MTQRPLRILLVGDYADDPRLGSAKVPYKLREEFRAAGHQCDALFAGDLGVRPAARQVRQLVAPVLAARAINRALARHHYDVVDAASAEGLWFGAARRLGRRPATVYICRSNGLEHRNYSRMLDDSREGLTTKPWPRRIWYPASRLSQVAAAARLADRMIVLTEADRQFVRNRGWQPANRIDVIAHGVSNCFLARDPTRRARGAGALFCGSWDHMKGISYLVAAFSRIAAAGRPVPLTILGAGMPSDEIMKSFPLDVRPHVRVIDRLPEDQVIDEYRRHDLLVFPSSYEGFGLVVLEAMSQGLPVVATPAGCAAGLVRDGDSGVMVPFRDATALAAAVTRLMDCPAERTRLGANAAASVSDMSWKRTAAHTADVYAKALAALQPGGRR